MDDLQGLLTKGVNIDVTAKLDKTTYFNIGATIVISGVVLIALSGILKSLLKN